MNTIPIILTKRMKSKSTTILLLSVMFFIASNTAFSQEDSTGVDTREDAKEEVIFIDPVLQPEFPGGSIALSKFLQRNIRYPEEAKKNKVQGKVYVKFVVQVDGSISDIKVLRGIGSGCDEEAIRVVEAMPKWKPGEKDGKPVPTEFVLPFSFRLY